MFKRQPAQALPRWFDIGHAANQGQRQKQEDCLGFRQYPDGSLLAVLADGMGGHHGGELASQTAIKAFGDHFPQTRGNIASRLEQALQHANHAVSALAQQRPEWQQMGTTLVAVHVQRDEAHWISVGDSLLYRFSPEPGRTGKLNAEHSVRERFRRLLEANRITQAEYEAAENPQAITSGLGVDKLHEMDNRATQLRDNETLLLASDGLLTLTLPMLQTLAMGELTAQLTADQLLHAVLEHHRPGQDNVSLIVIRPAARAVKTGAGKRFVPLLAGVFGVVALSGLGYGFHYQQQRVDKAEGHANRLQQAATAQEQTLTAQLSEASAKLEQTAAELKQTKSALAREEVAHRQAEVLARKAEAARQRAEQQAQNAERAGAGCLARERQRQLRPPPVQPAIPAPAMPEPELPPLPG